MRRLVNHKRPQSTQPKIKVCTPQSSHGWLEYKLNQTELDYVWSCVNDKRNSWSHNLAGNIEGSYKLEDRNDWFFNNTLTSLVNSYENTFESLGDKDVLDQWWVNYQKQYDFNPSHNHDGVYSFVIWLKIPYEWEDQNKDNESKAQMKGSFCFSYINMLGEHERAIYQLGKQHEGTMLLFPSALHHEVFPFYNCEEDRISVSGNIT
tara:strand:+ start:1774 stop:2391 length:618 start_codon:yes stop_codon:yes gene_type:complete